MRRWWNRVELSEFHDDDLDELQLLAACDLPASTILARVGGTIVTDPTKYTIRLANQRHLNMEDGGGLSGSVFGYINHSFSPNVRCIPDPQRERVVFETLSYVRRGEPLSFDYTTTEADAFAAPFVDIETGREVGSGLK